MHDYTKLQRSVFESEVFNRNTYLLDCSHWRTVLIVTRGQYKHRILQVQQFFPKMAVVPMQTVSLDAQQYRGPVKTPTCEWDGASKHLIYIPWGRWNPWDFFFILCDDSLRTFSSSLAPYPDFLMQFFSLTIFFVFPPIAKIIGLL